MEGGLAKPSSVQRTKEEIISILEECRKGKLNIREFMNTKGIHEVTSRFVRWDTRPTILSQIDL